MSTKQKKNEKKPFKIVIALLLFCFLLGYFAISSLLKERTRDLDAIQTSINDSSANKESENQDERIDESQDNKQKEAQNSTNANGEQTKDKINEEQRKEEEKEKAEEEEKAEALLLKKQEQEAYLKKADSLALSYDYDAAIEHLTNYKDNYLDVSEFVAAIAFYEEKKAELVPFGAYQSSAEISHIFFHSLIADTKKAFDNDYTSNGYNYYMTTIEEFIEMMQQMYDQGYVLVSIHDVGKQVTLEDGTIIFEEGEIMLPPDKKPFVLSQDDVNYYDYMDNDGFARRMVIDENGRPSTEMIMEDGSVSVGDYDMVPVLETFLETHPDFSYRGARGIIAITGYEGALGYRTDPASKDSKTYEQDKETVKEIAKVMREWGWEFACHSNGHRDMYQCTDSFLESDTNQWLTYVGSLIGETDIYIFPFGADIENTIGLYQSNKYQSLYKAGFRYFCGVYEKPWIQIRKDYIRMTRRPLDGQAMLMYPERLTDLFDLTTIVDKSRPPLK